MLERRRRSQLRLDPLLPTPTKTTTMRRTRRVCVNFEANEPLRSRRRRRREFLHPYFMTYPPIFDPIHVGHPWGFDFCPNEVPYGYDLFENRLNAGEQYECSSVGALPTTEETENTIEPEVVHDLKDILMGMNSCLKAEKVKLMKPHPEQANINEDHEDQIPESKESPLSALTDIMCDTISRLNNFIGSHSKQQEFQSTLNPMNQFRGGVPPVHVFQLPVQPLIVQSLPSCENYPSSDSFFQKKPQLERLPWLKERKRKRPLKSTTYIHMQSQGSSTDDLPKILEASYSTHSVPRQSTKDAGTTMWCPMDCCRRCCGGVRSQEGLSSTEERRPEDPEIAYSLRSTDVFPPPCLKAPPPSIKSEDEIDAQGQYYHPKGESIYLLGSPQSSSYSSSCDYRHEAGNLRYSFVEEEEEQVDEDDWYRSASDKLAELEVEQDFFKQTQMTTKEQTLQTDPETSSDNSYGNIIATSDKALSTTELNPLTQREPMKIERICKKSSLKQRHKLKSGTSTHKVMFEKVLRHEGVQAEPEMKSTGTDPIPAIPKVKRNPCKSIRSTFKSRR
ncbi:uncharacterized protein LOC108035291 [Drosophila biarmipes]|uniref:uncharacterized protein LOC108035291 n=1 Tax=Drosophila biarmipes TaxID=125945 RepID=UPI0007E5E225|nr:uncharacterized protein LOC108035291 [Drosophila biarmipes]